MFSSVIISCLPRGGLSDPVPSCLMTVNDITYVQSLVTADIS